jgi:hypothetical protein
LEKAKAEKGEIEARCKHLERMLKESRGNDSKGDVLLLREALLKAEVSSHCSFVCKQCKI